jgi:hypothetical protein
MDSSETHIYIQKEWEIKAIRDAKLVRQTIAASSQDDLGSLL